jgi:hypothetical protein
VIADQLASDEPLSPELVLVLPPELRAQVIARLDYPLRSTPLRRAPEIPAPVEEPPLLSLGRMVGARVAQLALLFVAVTVVTLAMSAVADAFR